MALGANSYGTVAEVQALAPQYTTEGVFTGFSRPTLTQVEKFLDRVSAVVNLLLAEQGFSIPITQADCVLVLDEFVVQQSVDLVDAVNRSGRFFSEKVGARNRGELIREDAESFIEDHSLGFELLGADRDYSLTHGLDYTAQDDAGKTIEPIFDRKFMRQTAIDWDTE